MKTRPRDLEASVERGLDRLCHTLEATPAPIGIVLVMRRTPAAAQTVEHVDHL